MPDKVRHRLLAILAAEAAGYSRLMAEDDVGTLDALEMARGAFRSRVDNEAGRIVDTAGDSVLAVFDTAAGAVRAAFQIQMELLDRAEKVPSRKPPPIALEPASKISANSGSRTLPSRSGRIDCRCPTRQRHKDSPTRRRECSERRAGDATAAVAFLDLQPEPPQPSLAVSMASLACQRPALRCDGAHRCWRGIEVATLLAVHQYRRGNHGSPRIGCSCIQ